MLRRDNYFELEKLGLFGFHPILEGYMFLEVTTKNLDIINKSRKLDITFLLQPNQINLKTISQSELDSWKNYLYKQIEEGTKVLIKEGIYANLEGIVLSNDGSLIKVRLEGFTRGFIIEFKVEELIKIEE